ncbi:unnamed protein product, partial [Polarella glacialis]
AVAVAIVLTVLVCLASVALVICIRRRRQKANQVYKISSFVKEEALTLSLANSPYAHSNALALLTSPKAPATPASTLALMGHAGSPGLPLAVPEEDWHQALVDKKGRPLVNLEEETKLPDGSIYVGELGNSEPHGEGKMDWPGGRTFAGQWVLGKPHGAGVMYFAAHEERDICVYSGQFEHGQRHGIGRCEWPAAGCWYDGDWKEGVQHGIGESGDGVKRGYDGDPHIWRMVNGERKEVLSQGSSIPGSEEKLLCVRLQASGAHPPEVQPVQVLLDRYGLAVGSPHLWLPLNWGALVITRIFEGGSLDKWNASQLRQSGPGAHVVLHNAKIWRINGV